MTDEQDRALREYNGLRDRLSKSAAGKQSQGLENMYGQAYQRLVALGLRSQIGLKYRRPKSG
jgi:hypothetical protein